MKAIITWSNGEQIIVDKPATEMSGLLEQAKKMLWSEISMCLVSPDGKHKMCLNLTHARSIEFEE
jgi:hypothetical protein